MVNPKPVNTVEVVLSKEHFDWALGWWFQVGKSVDAPTFSPLALGARAIAKGDL